MDLYLLNWSVIWDIEDMCTLSTSIRYIWALNCLKRKDKFYKNISISYGLNNQEILNLSDILATDEIEADSLIVENDSFESVDDQLNAYRAAEYETTFVP